MTSVLQYEGKRVIVTGAASGAGAATAEILVELGAEVHAVDIDKPDVSGLASFSRADLREPAQIEDVIAKIGKIVNGLFNCAAPHDPPAPVDAVLVNFCGLRALTEAVVPLMIDGSAIVSIVSIPSITSSAAGGSIDQTEVLSELLATPDFAAARAWCETHPEELTDAAGLSWRAVNAYTAQRSFTLAHEGIRINCVNAGPTDTSPAPDPERSAAEARDDFPVPLGRHALAAEHAWPMLFLNSPRSSFVTGLQFDVDGGVRAGLLTGRIDPGALVAEGFGK